VNGHTEMQINLFAVCLLCVRWWVWPPRN